MIRQIHLTVGAFALFAVAFTAVLVGSAGDGYAAPNLVTNGDFESDASGWTAGANSTVLHEPTLDADLDEPGSGLVTYTGTGPGDGVASQCIDLTGAGADTNPLEIVAYYREPAGQTNDPQVSVDLTLFDDAACTTNPEAHPSGNLPDANNTGWLTYTGAILITTKLGVRIDLVVHGIDTNDAGLFDKVALSAGALDTPTPTNTPIATDTPAATNTPLPTNTPVATNTPAATNTPLPTDTPVATNTAVATETAVAPTNTSVPPPPPTLGPPPASAADNTGATGAGGESPEGGAGAGAEDPEAGEVPESGTGPGSYSQERSHIADMVALGSFTLAIIMLGAGFALRKKYEEV